MDRTTKRAVLATLIKAGRRDLARQVVTGMKRPGPYLELEGKPGVWQVMAFQPHTGEEPAGVRRTIGELAWGRIQRVTKSGKPTGKEFAAYFFEGNKVAVAWKSRSRMRHTYREVTR